MDLAARMSFYYTSEAIGKVVTVYIMGVATEISGLSLAVPAFVMLCCAVIVKLWTTEKQIGKCFIVDNTLYNFN